MKIMKTIRLLIILLITYMGYSCSDEEESLKKFISDKVEISDLELIIPSGRLTERTIMVFLRTEKRGSRNDNRELYLGTEHGI